MIKQKYSPRPLIEILVATLFWGFGFVATVWALQELNTLQIIFYRFSGAFLLGAIFIRTSLAQFKTEFRNGLISGLLLGLTMYFQTEGLLHTTATKSGFITTLYVIIVPTLSNLFLKTKLDKRHWLYVVVALMGTGLIMEIKFSQLNQGDILTLVCALCASLHIIYVGMVSGKTINPFNFNLYQSFWIAVISFFFLQSHSLPHLSAKPLIGMLSVTIGSTLIGFYLQVKAQRNISPSLASLLFLLESPFSCVFALIFLSEKVSIIQIAGAALILFACAKASLLESEPLKAHI